MSTLINDYWYVKPMFLLWSAPRGSLENTPNTKDLYQVKTYIKLQKTVVCIMIKTASLNHCD